MHICASNRLLIHLISSPLVSLARLNALADRILLSAILVVAGGHILLSLMDLVINLMHLGTAFLSSLLLV